jgi:hypothetical protein
MENYIETPRSLSTTRRTPPPNLHHRRRKGRRRNHCPTSERIPLEICSFVDLESGLPSAAPSTLGLVGRGNPVTSQSLAPLLPTEAIGKERRSHNHHVHVPAPGKQPSRRGQRTTPTTSTTNLTWIPSGSGVTPPREQQSSENKRPPRLCRSCNDAAAR